MSATLDPTVADPRAAGRIRWQSPLVLLAAALVGVCILLSLPITAPIGPMYWDVFIYYDAANRIFDGQTPIIDFFTPVGPLGYYLFAGWLSVFPHGQPALMAHWSLLAVSAPLMGCLVWHVDQRSRGTAFALLVPFLIFALLPFNTREFYPFPGSDAFGIYNRQVCQILYILVASLVFVRDCRLLTLLLLATMTALFFLKITGFVAGGVIAAFALLSGRVMVRTALACAISFLCILAGLELANGLVSRYVFDIYELVSMNGGTLLPRFLQATSLNFAVVTGAVVLSGLLLWSDRQRVAALFAFGKSTPASPARTSGKLARDALFLLAVVFAGILFETQNTGSQSFIFLWPVLLAIFLKTTELVRRPVLLLSIMALVAATALPPAVQVFERSVRAYIGALRNVALEQHNLKTLGAVSVRDEVAARTQRMLTFYPEHRSLYTDLVLADQLPSPLLYSDPDFQAVYLRSTDAAIDSIRALEASTGARFNTIMSLNFVNPFPWLMDRSAPRSIAIGADPTRAVPTPGSAEETAVANTDLVLYPTCPPTTANALLYDMYKEGLASHRRIKLDACYDAFVNPKFAKALGPLWDQANP